MLVRAVVTTIVVLAALSAATASFARAISAPVIGLNANTQGWGTGIGARQALVRRTGVRWLREEFDWSKVEIAPGAWDWSRYDRTIGDAAQRGMTILPILMSPPGWTGLAWNDIPTDPSGYAAFTAAVAGRYGPGGAFWRAHRRLTAHPTPYIELWNEPDTNTFSHSQIDPGRYARLVQAAGTAGRAANPRVRFLMQVDVFGPGDSYLEGEYAAVPDLNRYFDGVAVHPYSGVQPPLGSNGGFNALAARRAQLARHGAGGKPAWITEIGWATCPGGLPAGCVSEAQQAQYVAEALRLAKRDRAYVRGIFLYHYNDQPYGKPDDRESWFGLTHANGTPKPAFATFRAATRAAQTARRARRARHRH